MAKAPKGDRSQTEIRQDRARRTTEEAMAIIQQGSDAMRKKTARLRKLRLEKEASEARAAEAEPAPKKRKAAAKKAT